MNQIAFRWPRVFTGTPDEVFHLVWNIKSPDFFSKEIEQGQVDLDERNQHLDFFKIGTRTCKSIAHSQL